MKLAKKEINSRLSSKMRKGYTNDFDYFGIIRGFTFETFKDKPHGELYETDEDGHSTFVGYVKNKKDAVNAIYNWFSKYAPQDDFD